MKIINPFLCYKYFTNKNIATLVLFVFLTQFVFIEGYTVSPIKVVLMALMPIVFIQRVPFVSRALILGTIYILTIILSATFHMETFRFSTIGYLGMFLITFITMYNLVYFGAFTLEYFIKFVRWMIFAFAICLICQQILVLVGIRFMPLVNLNHQFFLSINKLPSLGIEPSHSARMMGVLMYCYMECISFRQGSAFKFKQFFEQEHKWVTLGFLWAMLTMGSGTAFIALGVLSLYFINWRNALLLVPLIIGLVYIGSEMGIKQFDRAYNSAQAAMTLDKEKVVEADGSAYVRIAPMLNTINNLDLTKKEHWFGYGIDKVHWLSKDVMIAEISAYGFLAYILGLFLVFSCSIRLFSIPTIMYFLGIGGGTGNIAYAWGILMLFMSVNYFYRKVAYGQGNY